MMGICSFCRAHLGACRVCEAGSDHTAACGYVCHMPWLVFPLLEISLWTFSSVRIVHEILPPPTKPGLLPPSLL